MLTDIHNRLKIDQSENFKKTIFRIGHEPQEQPISTSAVNAVDPTIVEFPITISLKELSPDYLAELLGCTDIQADLLSIAILDYQNAGNTFTNEHLSIEDLIEKVEEIGKHYGFASNTIKAVQRRAYRLKSLNVLGNSIDIRTLIPIEGITIIDLSDAYDEYTQRILAAVCLAKIFQAAHDGLLSPLLLVIEEGHIFASQYEDSASKWILRKISREGRKFGLGLNITSQRIIGLDKDILSQCNTKVILKIDSKTDLEYLIPYLALTSQSEISMIPILPQGHALIAGLAIGSPAVIKIRERYTQHGGQTPIFIPRQVLQKNLGIKPETHNSSIENKDMPINLPHPEHQFSQPKDHMTKTLLEKVDLTDIVDKLVLNENEENSEKETVLRNASIITNKDLSTSINTVLDGSTSDKKQQLSSKDKTQFSQTIASLILQNFRGKTAIFTSVFVKLQELDKNIDRDIVNTALEQLEKEKKISKESKISKDGHPYILLKF